MTRRSAKEWQALFEAQARSGRTAVELFCRDHGLCPQYFSSRKKALGQMATVTEPSPFVRVERVFPAGVREPVG